MVDLVRMIQSSVGPTEAETGLADRLKQRTESLHREAERSGILNDLLRGRASLGAYALLLRNLLPVYEALESGLEVLRVGSPAKSLARREVYRAAALRSDLDRLAGPGWIEALPIVPSGQRYTDHVARAGTRVDETLMAQAYVRYLGDLNGGQILKRLLAKQFGLGPDSLSFYEFPALPDPKAFTRQYRSAIDAADLSAVTADVVLDEAVTAFRLNIELSDEISRTVRESGPPCSALPERHPAWDESALPRM